MQEALADATKVLELRPGSVPVFLANYFYILYIFILSFFVFVCFSFHLFLLKQALIRLARVFVLRAEFREAERILFNAQALAPGIYKYYHIYYPSLSTLLN